MIVRSMDSLADIHSSWRGICNWQCKFYENGVKSSSYSSVQTFKLHLLIDAQFSAPPTFLPPVKTTTGSLFIFSAFALQTLDRLLQCSEPYTALQCYRRHQRHRATASSCQTVFRNETTLRTVAHRNRSKCIPQRATKRDNIRTTYHTYGLTSNRSKLSCPLGLRMENTYIY